jgi:hypothetical protein
LIFESFRHKHLIHDENAYLQCVVGAAINGGQKDFKVEGVIALTHTFGIEGPSREAAYRDDSPNGR